MGRPYLGGKFLRVTRNDSGAKRKSAISLSWAIYWVAEEKRNFNAQISVWGLFEVGPTVNTFVLRWIFESYEKRFQGETEKCDLFVMGYILGS